MSQLSGRKRLPKSLSLFPLISKKIFFHLGYMGILAMYALYLTCSHTHDFLISVLGQFYSYSAWVHKYSKSSNLTQHMIVLFC